MEILKVLAVYFTVASIAVALQVFVQMIIDKYHTNSNCDKIVKKQHYFDCEIQTIKQKLNEELTKSELLQCQNRILELYPEYQIFRPQRDNELNKIFSKEIAVMKNAGYEITHQHWGQLFPNTHALPGLLKEICTAGQECIFLSKSLFNYVELNKDNLSQTTIDKKTKLAKINLKYYKKLRELHFLLLMKHEQGIYSLPSSDLIHQYNDIAGDLEYMRETKLFEKYSSTSIEAYQMAKTGIEQNGECKTNPNDKYNWFEMYPDEHGVLPS